MLDECLQNKSLRDTLIHTNVFVSRNIISFAMLEDMIELQGLGFSAQELTEGSDQNLIKTSELLLLKSETFKSDLIDYGIDDEYIARFRDQLDRFKETVYNQEISNDVVNQSFDGLTNLFTETDEVFEGKLEPIIVEHLGK